MGLDERSDGLGEHWLTVIRQDIGRMADGMTDVDEACEVDRRAGDNGVAVGCVDRLLELPQLIGAVAHGGKDVADGGEAL